MNIKTNDGGYSTDAVPTIFLIWNDKYPSGLYEEIHQQASSSRLFALIIRPCDLKCSINKFMNISKFKELMTS